MVVPMASLTPACLEQVKEQEVREGEASVQEPQKQEQQRHEQQLLVDACKMCALSWVLEPNMHPMVQDGEKEYIEECLVLLRDAIDAEGGLEALAGAKAAAPRRSQLFGEGVEVKSATPQALLRQLFELVLQVQARTGGDGIFVQQGHVLPMGFKKVVKLQLACAEETGEEDLSVCWDWDTRLESRAQ